MGDISADARPGGALKAHPPLITARQPRISIADPTVCTRGGADPSPAGRPATKLSKPDVLDIPVFAPIRRATVVPHESPATTTEVGERRSRFDPFPSYDAPRVVDGAKLFRVWLGWRALHATSSGDVFMPDFRLATVAPPYMK